jgi:hypothetical protein
MDGRTPEKPMRTALLLPLIGLAACAQTPADTARAAQDRQTTQVRLDKALAGLVPGETTSCIPTTLSSAQTEAYGPTLLYTYGRNLVYRTETTGGCENAGRGDILVTKQLQGRPCRGDIATTVSPTSRVFSGSCSLGDFTVYRRQRR